MEPNRQSRETRVRGDQWRPNPRELTPYTTARRTNKAWEPHANPHGRCSARSAFEHDHPLIPGCNRSCAAQRSTLPGRPNRGSSPSSCRESGSVGVHWDPHGGERQQAARISFLFSQPSIRQISDFCRRCQRNISKTRHRGFVQNIFRWPSRASTWACTGDVRGCCPLLMAVSQHTSVHR